LGGRFPAARLKMCRERHLHRPAWRALPNILPLNTANTHGRTICAPTG